MSTLAYKDPEAKWANAKDENEESFNSKDQLLMLDELREAVESLAQQISQQNSGAEINTDNLVAKPDAASSEKTPSIGFETASTQDEEEFEQEVARLVEEIANANSVEDLERISQTFSLKAELIKGRLSTAKSQKLLEAYLSLMATLQVLNKQIDAIKQNPQLQANFRQMAENIMQSLIRNQTAIRLAAERTMNQTLNSTLQNQLTAMRDALQKQLAFQKQQQTSGVQDALIKNLQSMLKAMETALKAIEAQRNATLTAEQAKRAQDAMRAINENITKLTQQLQQRLQAQLKVAADASLRNSIQQQMNNLQSTLNAARIAELNSRQQQPSAYDSGLQMAQNPAQQHAYTYDPNMLGINNIAANNAMRDIASRMSRLEADAATKGTTYPVSEAAQRSINDAIKADIAKNDPARNDAIKTNELNRVAEQLKEKAQPEKTVVEKNPEQLKTKPEQDIKNPDEKKPTLKEKLQPIENDPTKVERKREPLPPPPPQPPRPETKGPCDPCTNCNPGCKGKPETKVAADVNEERTKVLQSNAAAAAAAFTQPPAEPSAFQPPVAPANFTPPVVADATAFVPPAPPERSVAN